MRLLSLLLVLAAPLSAQQPVRSPARAAAPAVAAAPALPVDTAVHTGKLANGLQYLIRHNTYPEHRLELRLVVRAGSILEDQDQRGLAHFIEHMGFNGSKHFARNELVSYLESIGVRFGADLNAATSFDETTYILPVPSDRPELVNRAFDILQDWASGDLIDSSAVNSERGVILGEWRSGLGADSRIRDQELPILFRGSRYAIRLPIGDTGIIAHATPAPLKRFYHDWYRPDLMAVVAVGDYPVDSLRKLIADRFAALKNPAPERPRVDAPVPEIPGTRVAIITDSEVTTESVGLLIRRPATHYRTEADERRGLVNGLFTGIAAQRFADLSRHADAPFVGAGFGPSGYIRDLQVFELSTNAKEGKSAAAFEATLRELRRFQEHGVLQAELDRARASMLRGRESASAETGRTESDALVGGLVNEFLYGSVPVSAHDRYELAKRILPEITVAEVNAAIRDAAHGSDRFIAEIAPANRKATLPPRDTLLAILARSDTATMAPWTETTITTDLVPNPPAPGRVVAETTYVGLGVTDWRLSNGVRVLVKPTQFKLDQVAIIGSSTGGFSLLSDDDFVKYHDTAVPLVRVGGLGAFDAAALGKRLAGVIAVSLPLIDETSQGLEAITAPKDIENGFRMLWLAATAPRLDTAAAHAYLSRLRPGFANRADDPETVFEDTLRFVLSRGAPRARSLTAAQLDSLDPVRATQLYREWYRGFGDFTFVIVGNVNLDSLRPLVERWIGGLPSGTAHRSWQDRDSLPPSGVSTTIVRKGKEPVAEQVIYFTGLATDVKPGTELAAEAAAQILEQRLLDSLRQAMGATYTVNAGASLDRVPRMLYRSEIVFKSSPAQADTLWQAAQRIIDALRTTGPTPDELQKFVAQARRETEVAVNTNDWWLSQLSNYVMSDGSHAGEPLANIHLWGQRLDALTPATVQDAARIFFDPARIARFLLLPAQ